MAVRAEAAAESGGREVKHYIPYARSDVGSPQVEAVVEVLRTLPPEKEFSILLDFLVEFAGGLELVKHRMAEMLVDQAAVSYKAHAEAVKKINARIVELHGEAVPDGS